MEAENKSKTESSKSSAQKEKIKERVSTRFHLQLTDSTDRSFPEFSYLELLGANKNKKKDEDTMHDGECNVDEIRALAKKFEDKYGPKSAAKKSKANKSDRVQDLVDVTYGYDMTDSFVDDSEAYDELVPADWTTEHGGFYINMGELNFRPVLCGDEKSDGDFKESKKKKTPKKKNKENKEKKLKDGKRHHSSGEKEKSSKKMRLNSDEKESKQQKLKKQTNVDGKSNTSKEAVSESVTQQDKNKAKQTLSIENMNLQSPVIKLEKNSIADLRNSVSSNNSSVENSYTSKENENSSSPSVTLPDGLPPTLILSIQKLIEAARKAGGEAGKCKFFNSDVNRILLQIETDSRKLNCRARSAVYDYLALFLPCTKDTLLKRAKNLFMQEQVGRLREPLVKLRLAIEAAMPAQVKNYEEEVAKLSEEQAAQSQKLSVDIAHQNGEKKEDVVMKDLEVDGENEKMEESTTPTDVNAPTTPNEDKGKRAILPKRFVWKDDIRNLLCDVVGIKVELYLMSKSRSTTAEEALKGFLETEVRPIWPKGWMTTRILYRESKHAHAKVTSTIVAKAKKEVKRAKEEEGKTLDSNQQVPPTVSQKSSEGTKLANISTSSVSMTSDVITVMKTPDAERSDTISTDKQKIKLKPSVESKPEEEVKVPVEAQSQVKPREDSHETNPVPSEGASNVNVQGQFVGQSRIKLQNESQIKSQDQISQKQPPAPSQTNLEDHTSHGESQGRTLEIIPDQIPGETLVRNLLKDTLQTQLVEKSQMPVQGSVPLTTQEKPEAEPQEQKLNSINKLNLNIPGQSLHGQPPGQSLLKSPSQSQDHSSLSAFQNQIKLHDKLNHHTEEKSSLRKLLGMAEAQSKDQPHVQLQGHLQNQARVQSTVSAQLQGQTRDPLHGHRPAVQNAPQNKPHVQSHVQSHVQQSITQQAGQGKGRGQTLPLAHNQTQGQLKTPSYRKSQLESQNRIQSQLQTLSFPQGQVRSQGQLQGQFQGQFHGSTREDKVHPLSQVQSKSPGSPRVQGHTNSPNNHRMQASSISFSPPSNINKAKGTGKSILDLLDEGPSLSPPRNTQPFHNPEGRSLSHATSASSPLSSCSFQNLSQPRLDQISPPRNIQTSNSMSVSSPPLSSPNRLPVRNISPIRQMSNNTGTFNPNNISPPKRLSSCSLQNIPSKLNQEAPPSPRSGQGYNFMNKVHSSPNLSCQFPMQPPRSSPENHQRSSLNTLASNYLALSSSSDSTQLTATSLLNSLASMSQNHISPNSPLVGQSSHPNPLQNNGVPMSNNPLNISSMMNMQNNVPNNKPQASGFLGNMKNFPGMPRQFPNQQSMHRNNLPAELNDGNTRIPNYQSPAYRPFS